jgi:hypothetical protein
MFVSMLAALGVAQTMGLSTAAVAAAPGALIIDVRDKSVLRADAATSHAGALVSNFLDEAQLTMAGRGSAMIAAPVRATSAAVAGLAAAPVSSANIRSVALEGNR